MNFFQKEYIIFKHPIDSKEYNWKLFLKKCTYYVPTIVVVLVVPSFPAKILAIPKSEILGFIS